MRLVDRPEVPPAFPNQVIEVSRGPFNTAQDTLLLSKYKIDLIVAKNAGGKAAYAKIEAARQLEIKVIMIERPVIADRLTFYNPEEVVHWISVSG